MANVLKVTTPPSTNYNNTVKGSPQTAPAPHIKNQIDLDRVNRQDAKDNQQNFGKQGTLHYNSNYNKFLENLQKTLPTTNILSELISGNFAALAESPATSPSMIEDLQQFLDLIKFDDSQLAEYIKNQIASSVGFKSAFFDLLRNLMNDSRSLEFKSDVLKFTRKFNDMASNQRILSEIAKNLADIAKSIPRSDGQSLLKMADALNLEAAKGNTAVNLSLLKNEILPLLSKYIVHTNDFGKVRDLLSLLSLNISRYESGTRDDVMAALRNLSVYNSFREKVGILDEKSIEYILDRLMVDKENASNPLSDKLATIIDKGLRGQAGYENKAVFENMARSILVNQSVYMPLIHTLLPLEIDGKTLISEMWIDPDDGNHSAQGDEDRVTRIFLKFEILNLGSFDMVMNVQNKKVDLQLFCPEQMEKDFFEIKNSLRKIIDGNNLSNNNIYVDKNEGPLSVAEVFPKIKEGRNNINVTI